MKAKLAQILRALASQHFDDFDHFQRVADHLPKRLIHVGDQRDDLLSHALAGLDHEFGKESRILFALHEGTGAGLHIEHERIDALREFLAHDRRANQIRTLDGAGYVAQGVEFSIGGSDFCGLADHGAPANFEHPSELSHRKVHIESGNGFELVERPAGVAQTSSADHRDNDAGCSYQGSEHQRSLVSHAAGGMLVDFPVRQ